MTPGIDTPVLRLVKAHGCPFRVLGYCLSRWAADTHAVTNISVADAIEGEGPAYLVAEKFVALSHAEQVRVLSLYKKELSL